MDSLIASHQSSYFLCQRDTQQEQEEKLEAIKIPLSIKVHLQRGKAVSYVCRFVSYRYYSCKKQKPI